MALSLFSRRLVITEADLFHPSPASLPSGSVPGRRDVAIRRGDSAVLRGWYFNAPEHRRALIYCYGNADNLSRIAGFLGWMSDAYRLNILALDYRGYGLSGGRPSFEALVEDGPAIFDHLREELGERGPVMVMGRSIGTGMAVNIAAARPVAGLVLLSPPSSVADVIPTWRARIPWYGRIFIREIRPDAAIAGFHPQPIESIRKVTAPLLVIHGTEDMTIPIRFGRALYDAAGSVDKEWVGVEGVGHSDLDIARPPASDAFGAFLERHGVDAANKPIADARSRRER